jgi:hypothetical protein
MTTYKDIKGIVIGTANRLDMVPTEVVTDLCGGDAHGIKSQYLVGWEYSNIKCVTHAYMPTTYDRYYDDGWDECWSEVEVLLYICTVLVDNTPALFFIHAKSDDWWDPYTYTHILDICACSILMSLITEDGWVCGQPISEDDEVKELTEACGVQIEYGNT